MFGYVTICEAELKVKDFKKYKAYYCGLCRVLKERYGVVGQMTLTYDMTFAVLLLTSLYESSPEMQFHRCKVHPIKKQPMLHNEITQYAADMNILLTYYHLEDDWQDERKIGGYLGKSLLCLSAKKIMQKYPRQSRAIQEELKNLTVKEKEESTNLDEVAGCFGRLMEEIFVYKQDRWEEYLRSIGFFLGKFIYIMDAYDDLDDDLEKGCYNPLKALSQTQDYESTVQNILCMMIAECSAAFEKLPCIIDVDILRNILYDGVWNRYQQIQKRKLEGRKKDD